MNRTIIILVFTALFAVNARSQSQHRYTSEDYVNKYKDIAISEMKRSGVPASITLAQGMLESENGNSSLAKEGNNHFGIKCHDWTGKSIYRDDDARNECFRKYKSSDESFRDHSDFLLSRQRYSFLFKYKSTDYKSWANGLKKAGYATNPKYADMLIGLIEDNELYRFDQDVAGRGKSWRNAGKGSDAGIVIRLDAHPVYKRNNIDYIVVKSGDTFEKLARELEMFSWELFKYNEITKDSGLYEGEILYLQPKRRRAERGNEIHTVLAGETLHSISQLYGIKMKHLRRLNRLDENEGVQVGEVLNLRSKKKGYRGRR